MSLISQGKLAGKVALVTGGGRGIGQAIARVFGAESAAVVICSRNRENLERTAAELRAQGCRAVALQLDVTRRESFPGLAEAVKKEFGRLDILVNNAGISGMTPVDDPADDLWFEI